MLNLTAYDSIDLVEANGFEYAPCGHEDCDLGVSDAGRVQCCGEYCADLGAWLPPEEAYWDDEEAYAR